MRQFVVFSLGGDAFGIDVHRVVEILNPVPVRPVPDLPGFLTGVISRHDSFIPLMDLRKRFSVAPGPGRERIIIVRVEEQEVGLLVDSAREIIGLSEAEIAPAPLLFKGFKPEYLMGLGNREGRVIILLNTDAVLTAEERDALRRQTRAAGTAADEEPAGTA